MPRALKKQPTRDVVTTINRDGSRYSVHPADVSGTFTLWRRMTGYGLIALFIALPWIPVGGHPAVFLNVAERRFHLLGLTLAVQDAWMLFFLVSGLAFTLFYVTALFGRIWCGWACPQTVYLEHVYRRIERWIDGDAGQRRRLSAAPMSGGKLLKRLSKHTLFILVSFTIAHIFLAYFVSLPQLWSYMTAAPAEHIRSFIFVAVFTTLLYINFSWFREQLCIIICPYGRLQSALIDDNSLIVGYDENRGEPRSRMREPEMGDCTECNRCVEVCPTGIDIRQGLQMECVGCASCIDACNETMQRIGKPKGLIRYDSLVGLNGAKTRFIRVRTILYTLLMCVGASVMAVTFSNLQPLDVSLTRMQGLPYYTTEEVVRNQFQLRLLNKLDEPAYFTLEQGSLPAGVEVRGFEEAVEVGPLEEQVRPVIVLQDRSTYNGSFEVSLIIRGQPGDTRQALRAEFLGPDPRLLQQP